MFFKVFVGANHQTGTVSSKLLVINWAYITLRLNRKKKEERMTVGEGDREEQVQNPI